MLSLSTYIFCPCTTLMIDLDVMKFGFGRIGWRIVGIVIEVGCDGDAATSGECHRASEKSVLIFRIEKKFFCPVRKAELTLVAERITSALDKVGKDTFTSVEVLIELGMLIDLSGKELQAWVVEQQRTWTTTKKARTWAVDERIWRKWKEARTRKRRTDERICSFSKLVDLKS